jgi:hypothetical protein
MKPHAAISKFPRKIVKLRGRDLAQNASSSELIKSLHGSLAKPGIVLIDCEDLAFWTRSWLHNCGPKFNKISLKSDKNVSGVRAS